MAVDSSGSLYISLSATDGSPGPGNYFITKSSYSGVQTFASGIRADDLEFSQSGEVYTLNNLTGDIGRFSQTGSYSHFATLAGVRAIALNKSNIVYGASGNSLLRITSPTETIAFASLSSDITDQGLAFDSQGNLFAKTLNGVEIVTLDGYSSLLFSWTDLNAFTASTGRPILGLLPGITVDENDNVLINYEALIGISHPNRHCTIGYSQEEGFFGLTERAYGGGLFAYTPLDPVPVILVPEPQTRALIILSFGFCYSVHLRKRGLRTNKKTTS